MKILQPIPPDISLQPIVNLSNSDIVLFILAVILIIVGLLAIGGKK